MSWEKILGESVTKGFRKGDGGGRLWRGKQNAQQKVPSTAQGAPQCAGAGLVVVVVVV